MELKLGALAALKLAALAADDPFPTFEKVALDAKAAEPWVGVYKIKEGERRVFDLPLRFSGTPFQERVWNALLAIPYGEVRSYLDIARALGDPKAVRAVGAANGSNPISIVVPCHRVIGSDGSIVGYGGGIDRKRWLLAHERGERPLF